MRSSPEAPLAASTRLTSPIKPTSSTKPTSPTSATALTASVAALVLLGSVLAGCGRGPAERAGLAEVERFGDNPGNLGMYVHVPRGLPPGAPLVLALPGCGQSAADYTKAGWNELADRERFLVVYAQQRRRNNGTGCFNWFLPGDQRRGAGEPASLVQMVEEARRRHGSDPRRVFVTGVSAGGAMAAVLLAAYPDVFRAGSVLAAGPYACADDLVAAARCLRGEVDLTPQRWGELVRAAYPGYAGPRPRVSLWHGDADSTVNVRNLGELAEQWTDVHGLPVAAGAEERVLSHRHTTFRDRGGTPVVETWLLTGLGHAAPVSPGTGVDRGGAEGEYFVDVGVHSTYATARFWELVR